MPETIIINDYSDGNASFRPDRPGFILSDTEKYRKTLAVLWMADQGERVSAGEYVLDRLPAGYALWERQRDPPSRHIDRYLYGHPSGKNFDSTKKFWPHLKNLMEEERVPCECCNCRWANRHPVRTENGDEDGEVEEDEAFSTMNGGSEEVADTTSVVSNGDSSGAKGSKNCDTTVEQNDSVDGRVTRQFTAMQIEAILKMPSYMPRAGEVVLFHCGEGSYAEWKAGVVLELPFTFDDLFSEHRDHHAMTGNRVLIELFGGNPGNSPNGDMEVTRYVELTATRPLVYYYEILGSLPPSEWHSTIRNALSITASFALTEKLEVQGQGVFTTVFSKGVWIGPELILVGDMVRIIPFHPKYEFLVVHVSSVQFTFDNLNENNKPQIRIKLAGKAYANQPRKHKKSSGAKIVEPSNSIRGFWSDQIWYPVHNNGKSFETSIDHVLGRLHEGEAMENWFSRGCRFDFGLRGLHAAKRFWAGHESHLGADNRSWFWADSRQTQLKLESFNGLVIPQDVPPHCPQHELQLLQIIDDLKNYTGSAEESHSVAESINDSYDSSAEREHSGKKRRRKNAAKRTGGRPSGGPDDL